MAIIEFGKTENHFHGEAPKLMVSGDGNNIRDNTIKVAADPPRKGFEIFKIVFTQILAVLGAFLVAYLVYLFGFSSQPVKSECYFPTASSDKAALTTNQKESDK